METIEVFERLGMALGLGLLVGLQREKVGSGLAGVRTFPLITLSGAVSALLAGTAGGWVLAAALVVLGALLVMANVVRLRAGDADPGITTEVAVLLLFVDGALLVAGPPVAAVAVGAVAAVLLQFKGELHGVAHRLGDEDLRAIMQFALLSLVILPVLPDQAYGPYGVLNPRRVWLLVVLIVGINLGGYIAWKFLGERAGVALAGVLGGLISSTATTVSYSRRARRAPEAAPLAAVVLVVASGVVYLRVLVEVAAVSPELLRKAAAPVLALALLAALSGSLLWLTGRKKGERMPEQENPTELKAALAFAAMYALVLLAVAWSQDRFGNRGLYVVATLSGLTDVDAITLSTAQLVERGLDPSEGWRVIVAAVTSNLVFKAVAVAALGNRRLLARTAPAFALQAAAGLALVLLWPR